MKISKINLADIDGFKIGNAENIDKGTGCTVIICEEGAVGGVDVRGGAPATRETDLLRSENTVNSVNAVVISGGSAFGLEAASGVMSELSDRGIGVKVGDSCVPIVCGASLFDLAVGDGTFYPDKEMGRDACKNAYEGIFDHGNRGAGTGASAGKLLGMNRAMKTGLGTFACADEFIQVGAVAAVNAVGDIYNGAGNIIAGLRTEDGASIYGTIKSLKSMIHAERTDESSDDNISSELKVRTNGRIEIVDAIRNAFSSKIRDKAIIEDNKDDMPVTGHFNPIEEEPEKADDNTDINDEPSEIISASEAEEKPEYDHTSGADLGSEIAADTAPESNNESPADEDMGYDISFNTTIACLITNAEMTKSEANKLASVLHDAYARAIKPVHGTMDGDTIFVLTSGKQKVNFDAFAALATDVLQYAIIDGAASAKSAYGLPAACDIIKQL